MCDLVQRDGVYYKKFSDVPFSGKVTDNQKGLITNGKKEVAWIRYYVGGQLHYKGNYKNGKMEGAWVV
jgi:antitoxin component YwqK of YwqJK toxin-antitoxin module